MLFIFNYREEDEKKKQKLLEEQLKKEAEKFKQAMAEKEEKLRKQKADAERRRIQASKKALEEKKKDEERKKIEEQKKLDGERVNVEEEERRLAENRKAQKARMAMKGQGSHPIYMIEKAPLLPTDDCYDSDDPDAEKNKKCTRPLWARSKFLSEQVNLLFIIIIYVILVRLCIYFSDENIFPKLKVMEFTGHKIKNTLYSIRPNCPDLQEIFRNIDPKKLKRKSSAVWKKLPRFTMLPANTSMNDSASVDYN